MRNYSNIKNVGAALVAAHGNANKNLQYPWAASRVEREGWKTPSLPPRQSVRAVFPHTAFLQTSSNVLQANFLICIFCWIYQTKSGFQDFKGIMSIKPACPLALAIIGTCNTVVQVKLKSAFTL